MANLSLIPSTSPDFDSLGEFFNRFRELEISYQDKALLKAKSDSNPARTPEAIDALSRRIAQETFDEFAAEVRRRVLPTDFEQDVRIFLKTTDLEFTASSKLVKNIKAFLQRRACLS